MKRFFFCHGNGYDYVVKYDRQCATYFVVSDFSLSDSVDNFDDDNYIDYLSRRYERYPHSISFNAFVDNALSTKLAYDYLVNNVIPYDNDIFWEDLCPTRYFFKKWRSDFYDDIVCELVSYSGSVHFSDGASNVF